MPKQMKDTYMNISRRAALAQITAAAALINGAAAAESPGNKLVITGHRGNIGSRFVPYYKERGYDVVGIDKKDGTESDLAMRGAWEASLAGAVAILHLAGVGTQDASQADVNRDNILATQNLLRAASAADVGRIIFTSSCWVRPAHYREDNTSELPDRPYGWAKVANERAVTEWVLERLERRAFIIRVGWAPREGVPRPEGWASRLYNSTNHLADYFNHALTHQTAQYYCVDMAQPKAT
jgi:nucleoside-diphosphate-sugar epimerase